MEVTIFWKCSCLTLCLKARGNDAARVRSVLALDYKGADMRNAGTKMVAGIGEGLLHALRFALYIFLLLLGRVLLPIVNLAILVGMVVFLFCLLVRPDLRIPMWAGAGLAISATVASVFYEAALRLVAPADVVIWRDE